MAEAQSTGFRKRKRKSKVGLSEGGISQKQTKIRKIAHELPSTSSTNAELRSPIPNRTSNQRNESNIESNEAHRTKKSKKVEKKHNEDKTAASKPTDALDRIRGTQRPWELSEGLGGRYLNADPVFTTDEKYFIQATSQAIHIYSTASSILVQALRPRACGEGAVITAFALSKLAPENVYVGLSDGVLGTLELWRWTDSTQLGQWQIESRPTELHLCGLEPSTEAIYTLHRAEKSTIFAHFRDASGTLKPGAAIYQSSSQIRNIQVLDSSRIIVAYTSRSLILGYHNSGTNLLDNANYTFRTVRFTEVITCVASQLSPAISQASSSAAGMKRHSKAQKKSRGSILNLAVGDENGAIHLYTDILNQLMKTGETTPEPSTALQFQKLHWHRRSVGAVKWSLDGNYLMSGGSEGVLVLWQLDSGKKQVLPHLDSSIDAICVSPTGASYALQLANNSIAILSTSELQAKAYVALIQAPRMGLPSGKLVGKTKHSEAQRSTMTRISTRTPLAVSLAQPKHVLLAVPESRPANAIGKMKDVALYLQTLDITSGRHVSRQAITGQSSVITRLDYEHTLLACPEVQLLQVSSDGRWLATVEMWLPPTSDIKHLAANEDNLLHEQMIRREVNLKFWRLNDQTWELDNVIETPHQHPGHSFASNVFDLVADPSGTGFATVGEDGYVRIWKPRTKTRSGLVIRDENKQPVVTWVCHHSIELERNGKTSDLDDADLAIHETPVAGHLAYSKDGSILAASHHFPGAASGLLQLIDPFDGSIRYSHPMSSRGSLLGLAFSGRHLIFLADTLIVWDFVTDTMTYEVKFPQSGRSIQQWQHLSILAANPSDDGTFAVALPISKSPEDEHPVTHLYAFSPSSHKPVYETELSTLVVGLACMSDGAGFVLLDAAAQLRVLRPSVGGSSLDLLSSKEGLQESLKPFNGSQDNRNADDLEEANIEDDIGTKLGLARPGHSLLRRKTEEDATRTASCDDDDDYEEDDRPVVTSQQLAEALDSGSNALMSVEDMFWRVAGLYVRKPKPKMLDV